MTAALLAMWLISPAPGLAQGPSPGETPPESTPLEGRPYRIEVHLASTPRARLDAAGRDALFSHWMELVKRFVGQAWSVEIAKSPSPAIGPGLDALRAEDVGPFDPAFDKIWLVWADDPGDGTIVFLGREYDAATRWLGPLQRRAASGDLDAPRTFFRFTRDLFNPSALITGREAGRALLKVQGSSIPPASPLGAVVAQGTTFIPLRLVTMKDESVRITRIAFTYLTVEAIEGPLARCGIVSAFRDPLSQRISRPNTLAALGIKSGDTPLQFRFVDKTTREPAAGYTLTERPAPDGPARVVGLTDRSGRIRVAPGPNRGVVKLRLLAGGAEPLAEFPVMPGESPEEREITVDPLPLAAKYQVRLDALRDAIVDQVALRGRLEKLMQARAEGEDWEGLEAILKDYDRLPPPTRFSDTLKSLNEEATKLSYEETKTTVLTRNLQAQFSELDALIQGYLGGDAARSFAELLREKRAAPEKPGEAKPAAASSPPAEGTGPAEAPPPA